MDFDGDDDYGKIDITNTILDMGLGDISVSFWVYWQSTGTSYQCLIRNIAGGGNYGYGVLINDINSRVWSEVYPNDQTRESILSDNFTPDTWHLFTMSASRDRLEIYFDGVSVSSMALITDAYIGYNSIVMDPLIANYYTYSNGWGLSGKLSDLRIYNKSLSASEVQAIYNATK